jgi:L-rhamnose 1-dehydrogenase
MSALPPLLTGKVLTITGGLTGIGRAIAISFLSHGAKVAINYLPSHHAHNNDDELIASLQVEAFDALTSRLSNHTPPTNLTPLQVPDVPVIFIPGDISQPETSTHLIAQTVSTFSRLDIFISNAGICRFEEFLFIDPPLFQTHINTNLSGAFYAVQAAAKQMVQQEDPKGGSIIAISSISALVGGAQQTHYTPTKAGVLSLMQSTACALGKYNVRCNALLPGTIRTQLNDEDLKDGSEKKMYMEARVPLGRLGRPEDMAGPALFLSIPELSGYVTGASLLVDGGLFVNLQ